MPSLTIDLREKKRWLDQFRAFVPVHYPDWDVDARLIEVGDYAHSDLLGLEHKSPSDFLGSLQSGKLFDQAHELAGAYQQAFIIVDGVPRSLWTNAYVQYSEENIFGVLSSLAVRRRVPVLFSGLTADMACALPGPSPAEISFMTHVMKLVAKTQGDGSFTYNPVRRSGSKKERGLHLIGSLPGVGPKRARLILEHYGTPMLALANYKSWSHDIKGIGNSTVEKCGEVLDCPADRETPPEESIENLGPPRAREEAGKLRSALSGFHPRHAPSTISRSPGYRKDFGSSRSGA